MLPLKMEREFQGYRLRGRFQGDEARARAGYIKAQAMWRSRIRGVAWNKRDFVDKVEEEMAKGRGEDYIPPSAREDEEEEAKELDLSPDEVAALADAQDLSPDDIASRAEQQEDADEDADLAEGQEDADEVAARAEEQEGPEEQDSAEQDEVVREKGPKIVAHRIYLPNIQIRLMRNHTPPGEAYDPYVATFRLPPSMTKTDLRSYLKAVYDLDVTFIRTDLHWGEVFRDPKTLRIKRRTGSVYNYKRAVVGLHEPFHYPDDVQELYAMGQAMGVGDKYAKAWQDQLDLVFRLGPNSSLRTKALTKIYKRTMRSGFMSSNAVSHARQIRRSELSLPGRGIQYGRSWRKGRRGRRRYTGLQRRSGRRGCRRH